VKILLLAGLAANMGTDAATLNDQPDQVEREANEVIDAVQDDSSRTAKEPVPATNPGAWVRQTDYPPLALRENMDGRVRFTLSVDELGKPTNCTVTKSSGSEELDTVACSKLLERGSFRPALDSEGNAVPGTWSNSVKWSIRQSAPIYVDPGDDPSVPTCVLLDEDPPKIIRGRDCEALVGKTIPTQGAGSATRDPLVLEGIAPEGPED
jgi:TonB family protein